MWKKSVRFAEINSFMIRRTRKHKTIAIYPNGNLAYESVARKRLDGGATPKISERKLLWDGDNRLRALSDDGYVSLYWYNADGNRTVKERHGGEAVWVNSAQAGQHTDSVVYSVYPNPYINVNGDHWTKHYYIGGERVASRTGTLSGGFDDLHIPGNDPASAGTGVTLDYTAMRHAMEDSVASVYARLGVPYEPQRVGTRGEGGHLYIPITRDEENACDIGAETAEIPDGSPQRSHPNTLGQGQVYYYHRDHLGSTQSVTDGTGDFTQFVEYTPWGEVFVELKGDSVLTTPYLFNGKELDEETGLYYYGARYYDPKMSVWYSTDPMEMDYPWVTTYGYCLGNPIINYDPNGKDNYTLNEDGSLKFKNPTNSKATHNIFSADNKHSITVNQQLVNDLMNHYNNKETKETYAITKNGDDAFKFFKFASDNTNIEWLLMGISVGNDHQFKIKSSLSDCSVSETSKNDANITFHLHSHPKNSNISGTKASGDYKAYKRLEEGQKIESIYCVGDIWVLDNIYKRYQKAHPTTPIYNYPKAYIYYAGDNLQSNQLYQYNLHSSRFNPIYKPTYQQIKQRVNK